MAADRPHVNPAPVSNWNAANIITVARILFAPVFIWMLLVSSDSPADPLRWWAAILFVVGMATDGVDGWVARRFHLVTDFGKMMDPLADKILIGGALIGLSLINELPWWVTVVILFREIFISVWRFIKLREVVIPAAWSGKAKTMVQFLAVTFALLPLQALWGSWVNTLNLVLMTLAVVLTVYSGIEYLVVAARAKSRS